MKLNKTQQRIVEKLNSEIEYCKNQLLKTHKAKNIFMMECEDLPNEHFSTIKKVLNMRIEKLNSSQYIANVKLRRYK